MSNIHTALINLSNALGYREHHKGMCVGYERKGLQAFLLQKTLEKEAFEKNKPLPKENQIKKFIQHTQLIYENYITLPDTITSARNELKKKNKSIAINSSHAVGHEIAAFMDSFNLDFDPASYSHFFDENIKQVDIEKITPFTQAAAFETFGSLIQIASFPGVYNFSGLMTYISLLKNAAQFVNTDIEIELLDGEHGISICYDNNDETWLLFDANKPITKLISPEGLAKEIFSSLETNTDQFVIFNSAIITTASRREEIQSVYDILMNDPNFMDLHAVTLERATYINPQGISLAFIAARHGHKAIFKAISEFRTADGNYAFNFKQITHRGITLAFVTAENDQLEIFQLLAELKNPDGSATLDLDQIIYDDTTPALVAALNGHVKILTFLATFKKPDNSFLINFDQTNHNNINLVYAAALNGHVNVLEFLATLINPDQSRIANFNFAAKDGSSPAVVAAHNSHITVLRFLSTLHNSDGTLTINFNHTRDNGYTPALMAAKKNAVDVLVFLATLKKNDGSFEINFNHTLGNGMQSTHIAAQHGHTDVLLFLSTLRYPDGSWLVDFNKAMNHGETPAYIAAQQGHKNVLEFLATLQHKDDSFIVNFNLTMEKGDTPAYIAAQNGHLDVLEYLATLQHPNDSFAVDFNIATHDGKLPLDIALQQNHRQVVNFLQSFKTDEEIEKILNLSKGTIQSVYDKLIALTNDYINNSRHSSFKYMLFKNLKKNLEEPSTLSTFRRISLFKTLLLDTDKNLIDTHRTPAWIRYVANVFSVILIIPALVRSSISWYKYGTFHFWKAESRKVMDSALTHLNKLHLIPSRVGQL